MRLHSLKSLYEIQYAYKLIYTAFVLQRSIFATQYKNYVNNNERSSSKPSDRVN